MQTDSFQAIAKGQLKGKIALFARSLICTKIKGGKQTKSALRFFLWSCFLTRLLQSTEGWLVSLSFCMAGLALIQAALNCTGGIRITRAGARHPEFAFGDLESQHRLVSWLNFRLIKKRMEFLYSSGNSLCSSLELTLSLAVCPPKTQSF